MRTICVFLACLALGAGASAWAAMAGPNVTGMGMGNPTSSYQVSFTINPGDPTIKDFHLWWEPPTNPAPNQAKWATNMPPGWNCNTGYAPHPDPHRTGNVNHVGYTISAGVTATPASGPITVTFTYSPYGGPYTGVSPRYMITTDGTPGLPASYDDPDIAHEGFVSMMPPANFPSS